MQSKHAFCLGQRVLPGPEAGSRLHQGMRSAIDQWCDHRMKTDALLYWLRLVSHAELKFIHACGRIERLKPIEHAVHTRPANQVLCYRKAERVRSMLFQE